MFRRELIINLKGFIIWALVFVVTFAFVFAMYPSIIESGGEEIDQMLQSFPKEMLEAMNMTSISTAFGWVSSEGMIMVILGVSIYSSMLGINAVYREKKDKTIEYLATKPVTTGKIMTKKVLADICLIVALTVIIAITIMIGLACTEDLDVKLTLLMTLTPILVYLPFYFLSLFLSVAFKGNAGVAMGIPFIMYVVLIISKLADFLEKLKYVNPYTLSDTAYIVKNGEIGVENIIISLVLSAALFAGAYWMYGKKEMV